MSLPSLLRASLLAPAMFLLSACDEEAETPILSEETEQSVCDEISPGRPAGDINAVDANGMTELAEVSRSLSHYQDLLRDAMEAEEEEDAAGYREEIKTLKNNIRDLLRAGADPWARSLTRKGMLAPCARQYWTQDLVDELCKEGFSITDTPESPSTLTE